MFIVVVAVVELFNLGTECSRYERDSNLQLGGLQRVALITMLSNFRHTSSSSGSSSSSSPA